jgi:hypothetical protein
MGVLCELQFVSAGSTDSHCNFVGARIIDAFQSVECSRQQVGHRPSDLSEQNGTVLVGHCSNCIDEFRGRFFPKTASKKRARFASAHSPESASGGGLNS